MTISWADPFCRDRYGLRNVRFRGSICGHLGTNSGEPARSMYARTRSRHYEASPLKNAAFAPPCLSAITASRSAQLQAVGLGRYRSEEHTSDLQSLLRISYPAFYF